VFSAQMLGRHSSESFCHRDTNLSFPEKLSSSPRCQVFCSEPASARRLSCSGLEQRQSRVRQEERAGKLPRSRRSRESRWARAGELQGLWAARAFGSVHLSRGRMPATKVGTDGHCLYVGTWPDMSQRAETPRLAAVALHRDYCCW